MTQAGAHRPIVAFEAAKHRSLAKEVPDALASLGIPLEAADNVHMGMEDMLAARRPDIPSDGEAIRLEFIEPTFCIRQQLTEIGPLLRAELERRLHVAERDDHRGRRRQARLQHHVLGGIAGRRLCARQAIRKTPSAIFETSIRHNDHPSS